MTHWIHSDSPSDGDPTRPGRYCGLACDLFEWPGEERVVRVGSMGHLTAAKHDDAPGARTLCGIYLAGTPVAPSLEAGCEQCPQLASSDEPAGAGYAVEAGRG